MIQPKNKTNDLLLSITIKCETLIEQSNRKAKETLDFKMIKPKETFHLHPPVEIKGDWVIGLLCLEFYNLVFNITEVNNKLELYTDTFDEFSVTEL